MPVMVPEYSNAGRDSTPGAALRVGVVGASGWAALAHLPALAATPGLRLTAVSTTRAESARDTAARWGAEHHLTSAAELAHCPDVDLVTISVKAPAHRALIEEVLDAGKPILCEWPLGTSAAESAHLAGLLRERGIPGFIGLQATVHPVLGRIGRHVRDGDLGTLLAVTVASTRASKDPVPVSSAYTLDAANGAGMVQILGGHTLAALATALGVPLAGLVAGHGTTRLLQPVHARADGAQVVATSPDSATATLPLDGIEATLSLADGDVAARTTISIVGTAGRIDATTTLGSDVRLRQPQMAEWTATLATRDDVTQIGAEVAELPLAARNPARLYRAIRADLREGTRTAPTAADAVALHEIIDGWRPAVPRSVRGGGDGTA